MLVSRTQILKEGLWAGRGKTWWRGARCLGSVCDNLPGLPGSSRPPMVTATPSGSQIFSFLCFWSVMVKPQVKKEKNGIQRFRELVPRIREDGWTSGWGGVGGWMDG